jgi:phosphoglycerate dehydrogenase-like enzyme
LARILIFHAQAAAYDAALRARLPDADSYSTSDERAFRQRLPEAEVLVAHRFPVDGLATAAKLRWIQVTSAGAEFLAPVHGQLAPIVVTNGRGLHAAPIADYVMTVAVMLQSGFAQFMRDQAAKRWHRRPVPMLSGKTLGIVGLGSIGQEIARRAAASGMDVVGVRRSGTPMDGIRQVFTPDRLHEFLACCDFVVVAVPATDATRALLGRAEFDAMKRNAYVINIARGTVIDEPALIGALEDGTIAGAGLDVFAVEPLPADSRLWTLPNVIVTPHIAGMRTDYEERLIDIFVDNLARFERGEALRNRVEPERGY